MPKSRTVAIKNMISVFSCRLKIKKASHCLCVCFAYCQCCLTRTRKFAINAENKSMLICVDIVKNCGVAVVHALHAMQNGMQNANVSLRCGRCMAWNEYSPIFFSFLLWTNRDGTQLKKTETTTPQANNNKYILLFDLNYMHFLCK